MKKIIITTIGILILAINIIAQNNIPTPTISPDGGTFVIDEDNNVYPIESFEYGLGGRTGFTLNCEDKTAVIIYTTDGTTPALNNGIVVVNGSTIKILKTSTIKASAFKGSTNKSGVKSALYTFVTPEKYIEINGELLFSQMIKVEGGFFSMGSNDEYRGKDELPIHIVKIEDFYISKYEVTQGEYKVIMKKTPSYGDYGIGSNYPVNNVNWYNAVEYCNALSKKEGLTPCYTIDKNSNDSNNKSIYDDLKWLVVCDFSANGYRLPTEAEWEYASKGGAKSNNYIYSGSNDIDKVAWNDNNSEGSCHSVGTKASNELGLYDMSGNVWEWCWDWYDEYSSEAVSDPQGVSSQSSRVKRGGYWDNHRNYCRMANRSKSTPSNQSNGIGFRLVRRP